MKAFAVISLLWFAVAAPAQTSPTAHAPDGGVKERLQSIDIPPLTGAPFTAVVTTEWTHLMPDGTMATMRNRRTIARDSSGRIFQERRFFNPQGDKVPTQLSNLQYMYPGRHEIYDCIPAEKTCYVNAYRRPALAKMPDGIGGPEACACATPWTAGMTIKQEALGQKTIENVEVTGSREITTIPSGKIGNPDPEPIVKEFWYSPRLGVNLVVKRFDPRSGIQNFVVDHISLSEPNPRLFEPPATYDVVQSIRLAGSAKQPE